MQIFLSNFKRSYFTIWLADKVLKTIENEEYQKQALELAIKTVRQTHRMDTDKLDLKSPDLVNENFEKLAKLFSAHVSESNNKGI